jgi:ethanolamine permease
MVLGIIALLTGKTSEIITISCFGALSLYFISMISLLVLRKNEASLPRPFRVPLFPWFPVIALLISGIFLVAMVTLNSKLALIYFTILAIAYLWFHFFVKNNVNAA